MTAPTPPDPIDTGEIQSSLNELASAVQGITDRIQAAADAGDFTSFADNITRQLDAIPDMFKEGASQIKSSMGQLTASLDFGSQLSALTEVTAALNNISSDIATTGITDSLIAQFDAASQRMAQVQATMATQAANVTSALAEVNAELSRSATVMTQLTAEHEQAMADGNEAEQARLRGNISALEAYQASLRGMQTSLQNIPLANTLQFAADEAASAFGQVQARLTGTPVEPTVPPTTEPTEVVNPFEDAVKQLVAAIKTATTDISGGGLGKMDAQIGNLLGRLSGLPTAMEGAATPLKGELLALGDTVATTMIAMQAAQTRASLLASAGDVEGARAATEEYTTLAEEAGILRSTFSTLRGKVSEVLDPIEKQRKATAELTKQMNMSLTDIITDKLMGGEGAGAPLKLLLSKFTAVFSELNKIAMDGLKRAADLGMSAAEGVGLEFKNRAAAFGSIFTTDTAKMVTPEQMNSMQSAAMSTFVNMAEGMQVSSAGSKKFQQDLQAGFRSEFTLTGESLRALSVVGASSVGDFEEFRKATGRAALSGNQMATLVNKNTLSFLLFGNAIAGAAARFERLGISLSAIQKGQESFVTNLDGGIDTIAQLNQLGATLDFGTLTQLSEFGTPDQVADYIRSAVPTSMLNSASVRALFGQLMPGMDAETLLKMVKTGKSLDELEGKVSEQGDGTGKTTNALALLAKGSGIVTGTFGGLTLATIAATISLIKFSTTAGIKAQLMSGMMNNLKQAGQTLMTGGGAAGGLAAAGVGIGGGTMIGKAMGGTTTGSATGSTIGTILGGLIGAAIGGPAGAYAGMALGGMAGGAIGGAVTASDATWDGSLMSKYPEGELQAMLPAGFGDKMLVDTRTGETTAFNNRDKFKFAAGTELANDMILNETATKFPEGELGKQGQDTAGKPAAEVQRLIAKMDAFIASIQNANTTIRIDGGQQQQVSRFQLVGVDLTRGGATVA